MAVAYQLGASPLNRYRTQSVIGLSSEQLVLKAYDLALAALAARDSKQVCKVMAHLIDNLDFQYQEIALGLLRLYRYCMEQVKIGEFDTPIRIIRELRGAWAQALAGSP